MTDHEPDREPDRDLRDLLAAQDPAASLPPADPSRVARLLEDTMTDQLTDESRTDGTHGRSRLTWLVAAAAVVLIAAGVLVATMRGADDPPVAGGPASPTPSQVPSQVPSQAAGEPGSVTRLGVPAGGAAPGRCLPPSESPQVLAAQTIAFDGVVTSISGDRVTLEPTTWYAGEATEQVVVAAPRADLTALLSAVTFAEGGRYLVSATDGQVTLCGFSAAYSPALADLYDGAFGG